MIKTQNNIKKQTIKTIKIIKTQTNIQYQNKQTNDKNIVAMSWNKGNSKAVNIIDDIADIISRHQPNILNIQEMNIMDGESLELFQMEGYTLLVDSMYKKYGNCRAATYINNNMRYIRRTQYEVEGESSTQTIKSQSIYKIYTDSGR